MATESTGVRQYFPKVKEAREALREHAIEILESYLAVASQAKLAGKEDVALDAYKWLIEHMPRTAYSEGASIIDSTAAKPKEIESKSKGPTIQIGIALGGMTKELPAKTEVIDITPEKLDE